MILRSGVHIKTASWTPTLPFQCVWRQKDGIRCHVGRVFDPILFSEGTQEFTQYRFPRKKPILMRSIGGQVQVTPASESSVSKNKGNGILTGSVKVYYNTKFGRGAAGDADVVEVNGDTGYVYWSEYIYKNKSNSVYVVLTRNTDGDETKWILSLVDTNELSVEDIKIACISGSACVQLWQSDVSYAGGGGEGVYPFKVTASANEISVVTGGINNHVCVFAKQTKGVGTWYVYASATGASPGFPQSAAVYISETLPADNDSTASILLAMVQVTQSEGEYSASVSQIARGSQWVDRFKCSSEGVASYYWSRV